MTLILEFVNVMKGSRGIYDKYTYYMIAREHPLFSYIKISISHSNQADILRFGWWGQTNRIRSMVTC